MTRSSTLGAALAALFGLYVATATAQVPPPAPAAPVDTKAPDTKAPDTKAPDAKPAEGVPAEARPQRTPAESPLAPFAWLAGCWRGEVNQREFREHWMPLRGNLMVGVSQTVMGSRTQSFEYLRLENRAEGIHFVNVSSGQKEAVYKFIDTVPTETGAIYNFANPALEFPQQISYRRASEGWLYVTVDGDVKGQKKQVIYPMRRIGCETGEFIRK